MVNIHDIIQPGIQNLFFTLHAKMYMWKTKCAEIEIRHGRGQHYTISDYVG